MKKMILAKEEIEPKWRYIVVEFDEDGNHYETAQADDIDDAFMMAEDRVEEIYNSDMSDDDKLARLRSIIVYDGKTDEHIMDKEFAQFAKQYIKKLNSDIGR